MLLITGCGPAKNNPVHTAINTVFFPLTSAVSILKGRPNDIVDNYNTITGQCTETTNYDSLGCIKLREQQTQQAAAKALNEKLSKVRTFSLPQLDDYYEKEVVKNSGAIHNQVANLVKSRLIEENIKLGTFQGYLRAAQVSGNSSYVSQNLNLVKTTEDKRGLEQFYVLRTKDLNKLFDVDFKIKLGISDTEHTEHMGFLARHSDVATRKMSGVLYLSKSKTAPIELSLGSYRLTINITMHLPSRFVRQSAILGNTDRAEDYTENKTITADVSSPNMTAIVNVDFGNVQIARTKRGSMGGVEARTPTGDPTFTVDITKTEVI
jgi:hypothetical protein